MNKEINTDLNISFDFISTIVTALWFVMLYHFFGVTELISFQSVWILSISMTCAVISIFIVALIVGFIIAFIKVAISKIDDK